MSTQGLLKRANGYYFQARIPKKYLQHYPKQIIREKLPTENRKEAVAIVRKKWAELQEQFDRIDLTNSKLKTTISPPEIEHLIKLAIHSRLSADNEIRAGGVDDDMFDKLEEWTNESDVSEKLAVSRGQLTPLAIEIADDWLNSHDYEISHDSKEFREFALLFTKGQIEATKASKLRQQGIPSETPSAPPPLNIQVDTHISEWDSLDKLREYWLTQPESTSSH